MRVKPRGERGIGSESSQDLAHIQGGKSMKRFVVTILLLGLMVTGLGAIGQAQQAKIVVYSALADLETGLVNKEFTKRTGIQVESLNVAAAGTLAARIQAEKARPRAP